MRVIVTADVSLDDIEEDEWDELSEEDRIQRVQDALGAHDVVIIEVDE